MANSFRRFAILVLPSCNTEAMALHLAEISLAVAPGAHAILLLDQADGISRRSFPFQTTSRSCRCHRNHPNSTQLKMSGSSCARTGSRTASSNPTTTFSTTAASPGTSSSTCPGKSCPSEPETGLIGHDQRDLVLHTALACHVDRSASRCDIAAVTGRHGVEIEGERVRHADAGGSGPILPAQLLAERSAELREERADIDAV
jgi:hypothetical protein